MLADLSRFIQDANRRILLEEKMWRTVGSNQQPLDSKSNALPTALPRKICEVGFKQLLYSAIVYPQCYTSLRHACIIILIKKYY